MIKNIFHEADVERLKEMVAEGNLFVLTCHAGPDGDALGSTLGLAHYLKALGKEAVVIVPDAYPDFLAWMPDSQEIVRYDKHREKAELLIAMADVIFAMDYNAPSRVDDMGPMIAKAKAKRVLVDHHLQPENFCDLSFSYPQLSSTCEVVFRLIVAMGGYEQLTKAAGECIYTGMMTDTGCFSYGPCTQEVYLIISMLMQKEINKDRIYNKVYNNYSEAEPRGDGTLRLQQGRLGRVGQHPSTDERYLLLGLLARGHGEGAHPRVAALAGNLPLQQVCSTVLQRRRTPERLGRTAPGLAEGGDGDL